MKNLKKINEKIRARRKKRLARKLGLAITLIAKTARTPSQVARAISRLDSLSGSFVSE